MDFKYLIEKFTSRKFIAMLTSIITSILIYLGAEDNLIVQVVSLISSLAAVLAYIFIEGSIDKEAVIYPPILIETHEQDTENTEVE